MLVNMRISAVQSPAGRILLLQLSNRLVLCFSTVDRQLLWSSTQLVAIQQSACYLLGLSHISIVVLLELPVTLKSSFNSALRVSSEAGRAASAIRFFP
jgi:uncharacterized protein YbaP (TraB family)